MSARLVAQVSGDPSIALTLLQAVDPSRRAATCVHSKTPPESCAHPGKEEQILQRTESRASEVGGWIVSLPAHLLPLLVLEPAKSGARECIAPQLLQCILQAHTVQVYACSEWGDAGLMRCMCNEHAGMARAVLSLQAQNE